MFITSRFQPRVFGRCVQSAEPRLLKSTGADSRLVARHASAYLRASGSAVDDGRSHSRAPRPPVWLTEVLLPQEATHAVRDTKALVVPHLGSARDHDHGVYVVFVLMGADDRTDLHATG